MSWIRSQWLGWGAVGISLQLLGLSTSIAMPPGGLSATLNASVGSSLDSLSSRPSVAFEPALNYQASPSSNLRLRTLLVRPFNSHLSVQLPYTDLLGLFVLGGSPAANYGMYSQSSALNMAEWGKEGFQIRQAVGAFGKYCPTEGLCFEVSAGPYLGASEFRSRRNGIAFSQGGLLEQVSAAYEWKRWKFEVLALVAQDWNGKWQGVYSTLERVAWRASTNLCLGITHQLVRSTISEASGTFQPIGFYDARKSKIAGFVQWEL